MQATLNGRDWCVLGLASTLTLTIAAVFVVFVRSNVGHALQPWDCSPACPREQLTSATPADGLTGFGAKLGVWNYHHQLQSSGDWYPGAAPAGYLPAQEAARPQFVWVVSEIGSQGRVDNVDAGFWNDVTAAEGIDLVRPELPADARQIPTPGLYGCATSKLFSSSRLQRLLGSVLIRVEFQPDMANGYMDRYTDAEVRTVPKSDPCVLEAS